MGYRLFCELDGPFDRAFVLAGARRGVICERRQVVILRFHGNDVYHPVSNGEKIGAGIYNRYRDDSLWGAPRGGLLAGFTHRPAALGPSHQTVGLIVPAATLRVSPHLGQVNDWGTMGGLLGSLVQQHPGARFAGYGDVGTAVGV